MTAVVIAHRRRFKLPLRGNRLCSQTSSQPAKSSISVTKRRRSLKTAPSAANSRKCSPESGCKPRSVELQVRDYCVVKNLRFLARSKVSLQFSDEDECPPPSDVRRVRFADNLCVVEIPDRHSYTSQEKKQIWTRSRDIRLNARRNMTEFIYEDREAQNAVEVDDFILLDGALVHPAHVPDCSLEDKEIMDETDPDSVAHFHADV